METQRRPRRTDRCQRSILLTSGGGYIRIKDGNTEIHAPGTIDIKGAKKTFSGPTNLSHSYKEMPKTNFEKRIAVKIPLDHDQTKVPRNMGEANFSGLDLEKCILPKTEMEKRGWGTVILGKNGYGEILNFLEAQLKTIYTRGEKRPTLMGTLPALQSELESIKGYEALSSDSLRNVSAWSYPVFACGYNWLRSNGESADDLANYIQFVLGDYRTRLKLQCSHVILVTHSMGGLVARRCAQKAPIIY